MIYLQRRLTWSAACPNFLTQNLIQFYGPKKDETNNVIRVIWELFLLKMMHLSKEQAVENKNNKNIKKAHKNKAKSKK